MSLYKQIESIKGVILANHMERLFDLSSRETIGLVFLDVKSNCHNKQQSQTIEIDTTTEALN